ncbi:single-stranded DNA-dependent ATPase [Aureococcus anophagefferens]|nr:single-stranded DNA-dependent ATPase [Aureococcus anophagefferens]
MVLGSLKHDVFEAVLGGFGPRDGGAIGARAVEGKGADLVAAGVDDEASAREIAELAPVGRGARLQDDPGAAYARAAAPDLLRSERDCGRCFALRQCSLRHACVEGGDADSFGAGADAWRAVADLDGRDKAYYATWDALLDLEAAKGASGAALEARLSSLERHDFVLVSAERPGLPPTVLGRAYVTRVDAAAGAAGAAAVGLRTRGPLALPDWGDAPFTLRVDKDESGSSLRRPSTRRSAPRLREAVAGEGPRARRGGDGCAAAALGSAFAALNGDQRRAAELALGARDYGLVLGMPGTGKTSTVEFVVRCFVAAGLRVLVASYSHAAVDHLLEKLLDSGVSERCVARVAAPSAAERVAPRLRGHVVGRPGFDSVPHIRGALQAARVVGATCMACAKGGVLASATDFDVAVVDEAGQIAQPYCLAPLLKAKPSCSSATTTSSRPSSRAASRRATAPPRLREIGDALRRRGAALEPHRLSTVDRFQGKDAACVVISFAKANPDLGLGDLLDDPKRLNVALSRAKAKLVLVGAADVLAAKSDVVARLAAKAWRDGRLFVVGERDLS